MMMYLSLSLFRLSGRRHVLSAAAGRHQCVCVCTCVYETRRNHYVQLAAYHLDA